MGIWRRGSPIEIERALEAYEMLTSRTSGEYLGIVLSYPHKADATRRMIVPALQEIFVFSRSRAQGNEESARVENSTRRLANQIVTLLGHKPRDDRRGDAERLIWEGGLALPSLLSSGCA